MKSPATQQHVDRLLAPLARRVPLAPNVVTVAAVLAMAAAAALLLSGALAWAGALMLLSGLLDLLDGAVARAHGRQTRFGALLDRVGDRIADTLPLAALILTGAVPLALGVYALAVVPLASYVSACLEAATASRVGETLSLRALRLVALATSCLAGVPGPGVVAVAAIGTLGLLLRMRLARQLLR